MFIKLHTQTKTLVCNLPLYLASEVSTM